MQAHKTAPALPWGLGIGCLLWLKCLIYVPTPYVQRCLQYVVMIYRCLRDQNVPFILRNIYLCRIEFILGGNTKLFPEET